MRTCFIGFRVFASAVGKAVKTDNFQLRQSAVECAERSVLAGFRNVCVCVVTREATEASDLDHDAANPWIDDERLDEIWPDTTAHLREAPHG